MKENNEIFIGFCEPQEAHSLKAISSVAVIENSFAQFSNSLFY